MAHCASCKIDIGNGGVEQEDGSALCVHCDAAAHQAPQIARIKPRIDLTAPGQAVPAVGRLDESTETPWVTYCLLGSIIVAFLISVVVQGSMSLTVDTLLRLGAGHGPDTARQPWRILSSTFLHGGIAHLLCNGYALLGIGTLAERLFGARRFIMLYLLSGIGGEIASLWWNPAAYSVGASGAIFGIFGALYAFFQLYRDQYKPEDVKKHTYAILTCVGYNLFFGLTARHINNAAHLGGLVTGLLASFALFSPPLTAWREAITTIGFLAAFGFSHLGLDWRVSQSPLIALQNKIAAFKDYEARAGKLLRKQDELLNGMSQQFLHGVDAQHAAERWNAAIENRDAFKALSIQGAMTAFHSDVLAAADATVDLAEALAKPEIPAGDQRARFQCCSEAMNRVVEYLNSMVRDIRAKL